MLMATPEIALPGPLMSGKSEVRTNGSCIMFASQRGSGLKYGVVVPKLSCGAENRLSQNKYELSGIKMFCQENKGQRREVAGSEPQLVACAFFSECGFHSRMALF